MSNITNRRVIIDIVLWFWLWPPKKPWACQAGSHNGCHKHRSLQYICYLIIIVIVSIMIIVAVAISTIIIIPLDVNECTLGLCDQLCTNKEGGFTCSCNDGYTLDSNLTSCTCKGRHIIMLLYHPLQRSWKGGILVSPCPSVRPSVCPSVDRIVSALYLQQYSSDPFHIYTSY